MNLPEKPVLICRRAYFSAGLRLHDPALSAERNNELFGRDTLPHGHDYVVDVFYRGVVGQRDGMIVNLNDMKPVIARAIEALDGKFLDEDVPYFQEHRPTAENLVNFIWQHLPERLGVGQLDRVSLSESARVCARKDTTSMKITRKYEFAAAHRLHMPTASEAENAELYGKCNNPRGHGHNYGLEVTVQGETDASTGTIISHAELDRIVDELVYDNYDHKHLNEDCPEFKELIPTSENLARAIFARLQPAIDNESRKLVKIGLHETQKNYFEVEA